MKVFQMAGEGKNGRLGRIGPGMHSGVGLKWVCGIGETLALRISIHYKIALLVYFICPLAHMRRPRIRLTQDDVVATVSTPSKTDLSTLLRKDLKIVRVKGVDQPSSALPRRQGLPPQSRRLAQTGGRSPRTLNLSSTAETPVAPENTCTPLQSTTAIAKIPDSNFMS
jgi:hypothetical protein